MEGKRVAVIGAGIVGLACAYHLRKFGAEVRIIDPDPEGDKASVGNAGGIAVTEVVPASAPGVWWRALGWMMDPLGPLAIRPAHAVALLPWMLRFVRSGAPGEIARIADALAVLNARVDESTTALLEDVGLAGHLQRTGALSIYETASGFIRDAPDWERKRSRGIETQEMTGEEARAMEPALGANVYRAVFTPQWSHVSDPKQILTALRAHLRARGVVFTQGDVSDIDASTDSMVTLHVGGNAIAIDAAVIAAGAWSGSLARPLGDRVLLESERGYNATLPGPAVRVGRQLIFAEQKFVATPLSCGLRIGGAAEFGGLDAVPNYKRSEALLTLARRFLPELCVEGARYWAGHRPTTPDSLPVIGPSPRHARVFYAFGHGHLGLTQAAITGRLIGEAVLDLAPSVDLSPYSIHRFA